MIEFRYPADRPLILDILGRLLVSALGHDVACVELRVPDAMLSRGGWLEPGGRYPPTFASYYDRADCLATDAERLYGVSAYVTANPVDPALRARSHNCIAKAEYVTAVEDVLCLRWMPIDIDAVRPAGLSSTEPELRAALDLRDRILADHPEIDAASLYGSSGNGAWLLVRLADLPNDPANRARIARALAVLAARYSDAAARVDVATKNPGWLVPLPGTWKCKGAELEDRPHRLVTWDNRATPPAATLDLEAWLERQPVVEAWDERAATMEHDGGLTREEAERPAQGLFGFAEPPELHKKAR
jgi:hypothetical protein